jgi:hypothetical protein
MMDAVERVTMASNETITLPSTSETCMGRLSPKEVDEKPRNGGVVAEVSKWSGRVS